MVKSRAGSNDIDIKVSRHHAVSVSNFQSIGVSTDNGAVLFNGPVCLTLFPDTGANSSIAFSITTNYFFLSIIIGSFSLYKLYLRHKYRVSSIEYRKQFWYNVSKKLWYRP